MVGERKRERYLTEFGVEHQRERERERERKILNIVWGGASEREREEREK